MLDTDCCVALLRGQAPLAFRLVAEHGLARVHLSSITVGELLVGAARSSQPSANAAHVVRFCASMQIAAFDERAAASYAKVRAELESAGQPIGALDTLIAGHALAMGATLITGNTREFGCVRGLAVENWLRSTR